MRRSKRIALKGPTLGEKLAERSNIAHEKWTVLDKEQKQEAMRVFNEVCNAQWHSIVTQLEQAADSAQREAPAKFTHIRFQTMKAHHLREALVLYLREHDIDLEISDRGGQTGTLEGKTFSINLSWYHRR